MGCFDLAAARGIRNCKGKAACFCSCKGKAKLQAYPGDGTVPPLPDVAGDELAEWKAVEGVLCGACDYDSEKMSAASIQAAGHVPPDDHNFEASPWSCSHCKQIIWRTRVEFVEAREALEALKAKAKGDDDAAKKEYNAIITAHALTHMDQMLYQGGSLYISTSSIIVDPMHALQLNAGKVTWKWTIGNRMDAEGRERVAEFLIEINLSLDIREKGKRDRSQKWFSASAFDEFVLGIQWDKKSKSLGLARNIYSIMERVYADASRQATAARIRLAVAVTQPSLPPPPPLPLSAPPKRKASRKRAAPLGGFGISQQLAEIEAEVGMGEAEAEVEEEGDDEGWAALTGSEVDASLRTFLTTTYGNKSTEVIDNLAAWEAYGEVYSAWRDEWTADTDLYMYRAQRALRFLTRAM